MPGDQHEHVAGAIVFWGHAPNFDRFSFAKRRNHPGDDTLGTEREANFVLQVVVPTHGLRWAAAALLMTEHNFRKIMGYRDLWMLEAALERKTATAQEMVA
jgi:hypothetical protein